MNLRFSNQKCFTQNPYNFRKKVINSGKKNNNIKINTNSSVILIARLIK